MSYRAFIFITASLFVLGCAETKYSSTNKEYKNEVKAFAKLLREYPLRDSSGLNYASNFVGTINMSMRRPNFVIIHHTAQNTCDETLKTFTIKGREVSAHYVICRDGTVFHMLNDLLRAHHAGVSRWGNNTDLNSSSVGIELDNNGFEPFSDAQISSLATLLERLKKAYNIPAANFIGHGDIAPTRKNDPNWRFPWKSLSEKGFGLWWGDTTSVQVPVNFDHLEAIRIIGFDIKDTSSAIVAFKRHFMQDTSRNMTAEAEKVLFSLYRRYK